MMGTHLSSNSLQFGTVMVGYNCIKHFFLINKFFESLQKEAQKCSIQHFKISLPGIGFDVHSYF